MKRQEAPVSSDPTIGGRIRAALSLVAAWLLVVGVPFASLGDESTDEASTTAASDAAPTDGVEAGEQPSEETAATTNRASQAKMTARLRLSYEHRELGGDKDRDLYGYLYGSGKNLNNGKVDVYLSARLHTDFDEEDSSSLADDPFYSLDDTDTVTEQRLIQLYGDIHDVQRRAALRLGRQYIEIADYLQLDGGQLTLLEQDTVGGRVYFGQPVSYYSTTDGDLAGGLSLLLKPLELNHTRLTFARYYDDDEDESDQNYYLDSRQQFTATVRGRGQVSVLNDEFRMGRADLFYVAEDGATDASIGGSYWGSFDAKTRAYSPLYNTLGELDPYAVAYSRLTQQIADDFYVSPGLSLRFADEGENEYNNRDYQNYDISLIYQPTRAFSASIGLEYWEVEDSDSFAGATGELRYRHLRIWEVSGGVSYAQYTYDTYSDITYAANGGQTVFTESGTVIEESPYVRTYFIKGRWKVLRQLALRAEFTVEDDDTQDDLGYRARGSIEVRY